MSVSRFECSTDPPAESADQQENLTAEMQIAIKRDEERQKGKVLSTHDGRQKYLNVGKRFMGSCRTNDRTERKSGAN